MRFDQGQDEEKREKSVEREERWESRPAYRREKGVWVYRSTKGADRRDYHISLIASRPAIISSNLDPEILRSMLYVDTWHSLFRYYWHWKFSGEKAQMVHLTVPRSHQTGLHRFP